MEGPFSYPYRKSICPIVTLPYVRISILCLSATIAGVCPNTQEICAGVFPPEPILCFVYIYLPKSSI